MATAVRIEVYSDVVCPWCYIGKRRLDRALDKLADEPDFPGAEVVYRPFQLDPRAPRDRAEPVSETYARKFGGTERASEIIARVTAIAAAEGIEFHLDRAVRPNTADAHRLLWWALRTAGPATQHELNEQLMTAYFADGANVGDFEELVDRAARCGLDPGAAREALVDEDGVEALAVALRHATELGISAVPTFVIDSTWSIPGAQDTDYFINVLRRVTAMSLPADRLAAPPGPPSRGPLVFVHGFTQTRTSWAAAARALNADGYDVMIVDAPGHGEASDVRVGLSAGAQLLGLTAERATYVGYSMGGRLALHLAVAEPDLVERLVLVSSTAGLCTDDERASRQVEDERRATDIEQGGVAAFLETWLDQPLFAHLPPEATQLADRLVNTPSGLASSLRLAGTGAQQSLWPLLPSLSMPVLLVVGALDDKFAVIAEQMAALIPDVVVEVIPGAGHVAHLERPDEFRAALRRWLDATPPSSVAR